MKTKIFILALALALLLPVLSGCAVRYDESCPIGDYDAENVFEGDDGRRVVIKQKKMSLENEDFELILVENESDAPVSLDIIVKYADADGNLTLMNRKYIEGIPVDYSGFVLFRPECRFDSCSAVVRADPFEGETLLQYVKPGYGLGLLAYAGYDFSLGYGEEGYDNPIVRYDVTFGVTSSSDEEIRTDGYLIGFDSDGEPIFLTKKSLNASKGRKEYDTFVEFRDRPWDDNMTLPDSLLGDLHCIYAIESAEPEKEYRERMNKIMEQAKKQIEEQKKKNGG
ncbi:MAG: hypothetical protein IKI91_02470 [Clostridia bacterium]|nr:hypothetical protein [Clostridia bacterium]